PVLAESVPTSSRETTSPGGSTHWPRKVDSRVAAFKSSEWCCELPSMTQSQSESSAATQRLVWQCHDKWRKPASNESRSRGPNPRFSVSSRQSRDIVGKAPSGWLCSTALGEASFSACGGKR